VRAVLERLEQGGTDPTAALAYLAVQELGLDEEELHASRRRAVFVLAAGGDPGRDLSPAEPAVASLARDLDSPLRRRLLAAGLERLAGDAAGLAEVSAALGRLSADAELAWRWAACALLAEELAEG
jgi:hypothetical protein